MDINVKKPTLIDVGEEAGVSAITVSRALRSPEKVSDSLRRKVQAAVDKLGYVPNAAAATLASKETNALVVIIPSVSNQVFADVLAGLSEAIKGTNLALQLGNSDYDPLKEEALIRAFLNPRPKGLILAGVEQTKATRKLLKAAKVPVVQIMDIDGVPIDKLIGFSHEQAGYEATLHLLDQGYENVGFIGAQMDPRSQKRFSGYKRAMVKSGWVDELPVSVTNEPSSVAMGGTLYQNLIRQFPACNAVFCNNDDLSLGVLFECLRRGLKVPKDFGICGFNDLGTTEQCVPKITSVATPLHQLGNLAGKYVVSGDWDVPGNVIPLGCEILQRDSTSLRNWSG